MIVWQSEDNIAHVENSRFGRCQLNANFAPFRIEFVGILLVLGSICFNCRTPRIELAL